MQDMHVIVGLYYLTVKNHFYAAPNKYYEHLLLGRALLTTQNTPPGQRVTAHGTGWAVREGFAALQHWFSGLTADAVSVAGVNARRLWKERYESYFEDHYLKQYGDILEAMCGNSR